MTTKRAILILIAVALAAIVVLLAAGLAHHLLPYRWTGESQRLAEMVGAAPGHYIADIGAGDGSLAREMARIVGPTGRIFATEIDSDLRQEIQARAATEGLPQLSVVEAQPSATNLPDACCRAAYLRHVLHHIDDWPAFAADLRRTIQPGGILAIIDFPPGAMLSLLGDHTASPEDVTRTFVEAGFRLERRIDDWGGATYLLTFRRPG